MAKYSDREAYPPKLFPIFLDSFLITDSEAADRTKTVDVQKVYNLFLEALSESAPGFSQNNKFRFIYLSIVIGGPGIDLSNPATYEGEIINKINAQFSGFPLEVLDDELIIFKIQVVEFGTFYTHFRKYFFPNMLGKGNYSPLSSFVDANQLEVAYIQNTSSVSSPEIIEASPNNVIFDLGDITGQDLLTYVNTVSIPELPNGYDLTDTNKIYYFRFIDDGTTYLYYFDAENSLNGYGEYGADGAYLFQVGELILMFDSTIDYPTISISSKEDKVSGVIAYGTDEYNATVPEVTQLVTGLKILVTFENPNTGASRMNLNALSDDPIVKNYDTPVVAGDLTGTMTLMYNIDKWVVVGSVNNTASVPLSGTTDPVTGNIEIRSTNSNEKALILSKEGTVGITKNPKFLFGRIVNGGINEPKLRILFIDDEAYTSEVTCFEVEPSGTAASVRQVIGSHYEAFLEQEEKPLFRIASFLKDGMKSTRMEFGSGGNNETDIFLERWASWAFALVMGGSPKIIFYPDSILRQPGVVDAFQQTPIGQAVGVPSADVKKLFFREGKGLVELGNDGIERPIAKDNETFETVSKNLKGYPYALDYTSGKLTSIVYTLPTGTITKTLNYTGEKLTSIVLSGNTPNGINLTKTLSYTGDNLLTITYE